MSQKASGYERQPADLYPTPAWVVDALNQIVPLKSLGVWEPACGTCQMVAALREKGAYVVGSDLEWYPEMAQHEFTCMDFLSGQMMLDTSDAIITNPPYGYRGALAEKFIERGLELLRDNQWLALLLRVDFDSAKTRRKYFEEHNDFVGKIVLTRRIKWFDDPNKKSGPTENHAWFLWRGGNLIPPRLFYAPRPIYAAKRR